MKKTSMLLAIVMLLCALVPTLAFGAAAVAAGDVSATSGSAEAYYYADDTAALAGGAIAKFTKGGATHYVKDLAAVFAFGGDAENGADTVTMIAKTVDLKAQAVLTAKGSFTTSFAHKTACTVPNGFVRSAGIL